MKLRYVNASLMDGAGRGVNEKIVFLTELALSFQLGKIHIFFLKNVKIYCPVYKKTTRKSLVFRLYCEEVIFGEMMNLCIV